MFAFSFFVKAAGGCDSVIQEGRGRADRDPSRHPLSGSLLRFSSVLRLLKTPEASLTPVLRHRRPTCSAEATPVCLAFKIYAEVTPRGTHLVVPPVVSHLDQCRLQLGFSSLSALAEQGQTVNA